MSIPTFYIQVVKALEELQVDYLLVGAFAGTSFGILRTTYDLDMLVRMKEDDYDRLANYFPLPRYYVDPEMMRNSTRLGIMFNLIDTNEGVKVDLIPLKGGSDYDTAFERRVRRTFIDNEGVRFTAWCALPEDIMIGKLHAWTEGRSHKHPADIYDMLIFLLSEQEGITFDPGLVTRAASRIGVETLYLWQELLARAEREVEQHKNTGDSL